MEKRILAIVLVLVMLVAFAGCAPKAKKSDGQTTAESSSTAAAESQKTPAEIEIATGEVKLVGYVPGDLPEDYAIVAEQMNAILKKGINATVEFHGVPWGDFDTKYPLILASGETCDLIYTADWSFYYQFINKNALAPLDDLLADYCPFVLEKESADYIQSARVDGKLYMIPSNFPNFNSHGYVVRGDLMNKYGITDIKDYKDFFAYLKAIKSDVAIPFDTMADDYLVFMIYQQNRDRIVQSKFNNYMLINKDGSITCALDDPAFIEFIQEARKAYNDGLWSKSVLSSQEEPKASFLSGKSGGFVSNVYGLDSTRAAAIQNGNESWDVRFYESGYNLPNQLLSAVSNGISIPFASKHVKRACMLVNEFNKDFELWKLLNLGIKGVHYDINDKNERVLPAGKKADDIKYNGFAFCWGTNDIEYNYYYTDPLRTKTMTDTIEKAKTKGKMDNLMKYGFAFKSDNIKAEEAAVTAAITKYFIPLVWGTLDPGKGIEECKKKLNAAGFEKVKADYEKQIKDHMAKFNLTTLLD